MQSNRLKAIIAVFAALILFQLFSLFQNGIWGIAFVAPLLLGVLLATALALFSSENKKTSPVSTKARAAASFEANSQTVISSDSPEDTLSERVQGEVKWFNPEKGFGFIAQDSGEDLFVHYTEVHLEENEFLEKGDRVELEVGPGRKGPVAKNVIRLSSAEKKDDSVDADNSSDSKS